MKIAALIIFLTASAISNADYYPQVEHQVYGSPATTSDQSAIDDVMRDLWLAWSEHDAAAFANVHSIDAEWTNAFGRTFRGSNELESFLEGRLFPAFDIEISKNEADSYVEISRRYIGKDCAVITGRTESNRGSSVGSSNRKIGFTFVLSKTDGEWKVTNQVITDIRERRG